MFTERKYHNDLAIPTISSRKLTSCQSMNFCAKHNFCNAVMFPFFLFSINISTQLL